MIKVYNRITKSYEEELVAGKGYLEWIYGSPIGKSITELIVKKKLFSKTYDMFCDSKLSANKIQSFFKKFNIDMTNTKKEINEFTSFNDFFTRELNPI
jgi:phosphatidylserine decarboxylase